MRSCLTLILAPTALAGVAYAAAQSLAVHDWLAAPLLLVLAVGVVLIAPGDETPEAAPEAPLRASAQPLHRAGAAVGNRRAV